LVQPERAVAHVEHKRCVVRHDQQRHAAIQQLAQAPVAFLLKKNVSHAQGLVDDQDIGIDRHGHGKGHAHQHAGGIGLHRLLDETADVGEALDLVQLAVHLRLADAENRAGQIDVFPARELGIEARPQLQQRRHAAADVQFSGGGLQGAGEDLAATCFSRRRCAR
jgi:hypothetical protein